ncbi:MAG: hypothetical protein KAH38_12290 [Candidatus Hydrogenedentes bacterium]|nr:hypothetical protein [Candidatus Hydrogenedentota bacterium]
MNQKGRYSLGSAADFEVNLSKRKKRLYYAIGFDISIAAVRLITERLPKPSMKRGVRFEFDPATVK